LANNEESGPMSHSIYIEARFALTKLPQILQLLQRDIDVADGEVTSDANSYERLTTILIEEKGFSSPERMILLFQSI
jgi:hypothetical protein